MNLDAEHEEMLRRVGRHPDQIAARAANWAKARKMIRKPVARWPAFDPKWDCDEASFYLSLDGESQESFNSLYPQGVCCSEVDLSELDRRLCALSQRSATEIWGFDDAKVAEAIRFWAEGGEMTPPMIVLVEGTSELHVAGGNNRLSVVRAKGVARIKILVRRDELAVVKDLLPSLREDTPTAGQEEAGVLAK
ncbi:hypothetical protein PQR34_34615 [Paraburkholderia sediminicola]|uniref:hypothetical protein n=1 Tax=Paraburkholderia sediminicola TaxID=458836 RepID=UPI0038B6E775